MHTAVLMATRVSYTVNSLLNKIFTYVFAKRKMFTLWHVALHEGGKQALDSLQYPCTVSTFCTNYQHYLKLDLFN